MDYDALLAQAIQTNAQRDQIDRNHGNAPPGNCPIIVHLRTVASAIEAGIRSEDWNAVAEGQVMLLDAIDLISATRAAQHS